MATLSTLQILSLSSIAGVGPKAIVKLGKFLEESGTNVKSFQDLSRVSPWFC